MKELLENIVKAIVNEPGTVSIVERESVDFPGLTILTVNVAPTDLGVLIGKKGRTINAIRDIVTIAAIRTNKRVRVVVNEGDKQTNEVEEIPSGNKVEEKVDSVAEDADNTLDL
jgi:predicted RNA-binding protein YlqC (UPF0109 family)